MIVKFWKWFQNRFAKKLSELELSIIQSVSEELKGDFKVLFDKQIEFVKGVSRSDDFGEVYFQYESHIPKDIMFSFKDKELKLAELKLEYYGSNFLVECWVVDNFVSSIEYKRQGRGTKKEGINISSCVIDHKAI